MVRRPQVTRQRQRGAASVVIAILFLVIAGYAAVAALEMSATTVSDASLDESGSQAQFLAESALERGFARFKGGTPCSGVGPDGPYAFGNGQFTVLSGADEGVNCRVTAVGQVGNAQRQISALAAPGTYDYLELFPSATDFANNWTASFSPSNKGSNVHNTANCSVCAGATGGSLLMQTNAGGNNDRHRGSLQRDLASALSSRNGITVTVTLGYKKAVPNANATRQDVSVSLVSSATGNTVTLWSHTTISNANAWVAVNQTVTLPAGQIYDRLQVDVDLQENGNRQIQVWVDEIHIQFP